MNTLPVYVPVDDKLAAFPVTVTDAEPFGEREVEVVVAVSHVPPVVVAVNVKELPVRFWTTSVCDCWLPSPAVSETLPGVTIRVELLALPVLPPQLLFCV
jgi:hypothetical protein